MKFRRKSTVVEAEQFKYDGENHPGVHWSSDGRPFVLTLHGMVTVSEGDWLIPETDTTGYYPVKDEIFKATYEPYIESNVRLRVVSPGGWLDYDSNGQLSDTGYTTEPRVELLKWLNSGVEIIACVRRDLYTDFYYRTPA